MSNPYIKIKTINAEKARDRSDLRAKELKEAAFVTEEEYERRVYEYINDAVHKGLKYCHVGIMAFKSRGSIATSVSDSRYYQETMQIDSNVRLKNVDSQYILNKLKEDPIKKRNIEIVEKIAKREKFHIKLSNNDNQEHWCDSCAYFSQCCCLFPFNVPCSEQEKRYNEEIEIYW